MVRKTEEDKSGRWQTVGVYKRNLHEKTCGLDELVYR